MIKVSELVVDNTKRHLVAVKHRYQLFNDTGITGSQDYSMFLAHANLMKLVNAPLTVDSVANLITWELEEDCDTLELAHVCMRLGIIKQDDDGNLRENAEDFPELFTQEGVITKDGEPQGSFSVYGSFAITELYLDFKENPKG